MAFCRYFRDSRETGKILNSYPREYLVQVDFRDFWDFFKYRRDRDFSKTPGMLGIETEIQEISHTKATSAQR